LRKKVTLLEARFNPLPKVGTVNGKKIALEMQNEEQNNSKPEI
jgi:hypothetical protein